jgi:hydroxyacylglutathione hydrolase
VPHIQKFTFNPFQENTWIISEGAEAIVVDPGCWNRAEEQELEDHLVENGLTPVRLVLTHAHLDHVFGCSWMHKRYGLLPQVHSKDLPLLRNAERQGLLYGTPCEPVPEPDTFLEAGGTLSIGSTKLEILHVPGHSPGHIALWSAEERFVVSGDVLFQGSIGRTDLPGGDMGTLLTSIREKLFPLGDDVVVHCGHGPDTTIGKEKRSNPFLR